jgi:hypothetical protein
MCIYNPAGLTFAADVCLVCQLAKQGTHKLMCVPHGHDQTYGDFFYGVPSSFIYSWKLGNDEACRSGQLISM